MTRRSPALSRPRTARLAICAMAAASAFVALFAPSARAEGEGKALPEGEGKATAVVWPTLTPAGDAPSAVSLHAPQAPGDKRELLERAQELDATLRDATQDLGLTLAVADGGPAPGHLRDEDLLARSAGSRASALDAGTWVISPRLEPAGGGEFLVRIVVVPPHGRELRVRVETVAAESVSVRGLVMLRDLLSPSAAARAAIENERELAAHGTSQGIMSPLRSQGRAVLAVNAGLFGAFVAYSVQRASGSTDPRVLYPLLALGTGVGVGGALLVADEWDVTTGDAWFLAGGAVWGAAAGFLIAAGRDAQPLEDRYAWGAGGALIGLTAATLALARSTMDDGDAMLANSGAAVGLLLGGAGELLYRGATPGDWTPQTGMGYGSAIGLLAAGTLATRVTMSPSRVLLVDVGVGGGALLGAAAASPLIFENATAGNTRGWLAATIAGSIGGGLATYLLTRDAGPLTFKPARYGLPTAGVIGESVAPGHSVPIFGVGWRGKLD